METIKVHIIRRTMLRPSIHEMLARDLNGYLQAVLDRNSGALRQNFSIDVVSTNSCPQAAHELDVLIYVVQDPEHTISPQTPAHASGHGGRTYHGLPGGTSASEIYARTESGALLAKVSFHEMLHHKTGWGNQRLHSDASAGIAVAHLRVDTDVTPANLDLLGQHISTRRPPWLCT